MHNNKYKTYDFYIEYGLILIIIYEFQVQKENHILNKSNNSNKNGGIDNYGQKQII